MTHPKKEKTFVIVKPDGIQRSLIGEIISRLEKVGLKLVALKMLVTNEDHVEKHYTLDSQWRQLTGQKAIEAYRAKGLKSPSEDPLKVSAEILKNLRKYITSGPVIVMIWEGAHAVKITRKLVGGTEPLTSDVGTLRGDYVLDSYSLSDGDGRAVRNLIHASGSIEDAEKEIKHWFEPNEIIKYRLVQEEMLYDVNLDGILE